MSGTKEGGRKAAETNKRLHGEDFYAQIGKKGGYNGRGPLYKGGFASNLELAKSAGRKGGKISRRGNPYGQIFEKNRRKILKLWYKDEPYSEIARQIGVPYAATRNWVRKNVEGGI